MLASELIEILKEIIETEGDYEIVYPDDENTRWPHLASRAVVLYTNNRQIKGNVVQIE